MKEYFCFLYNVGIKPTQKRILEDFWSKAYKRFLTPSKAVDFCVKFLGNKDYYCVVIERGVFFPMNFIADSRKLKR